MDKTRWLASVRLFMPVAAVFLFTRLFSGMPAIAQALSPSDIPAETFAALPQVRALSQSPDGTKVAYLSSLQGRTVMVVQNLDGSEQAVQPPIREADIFAFRWANNERLLVMYEYFTVNVQYAALKDRETRLSAVNADGSDFEWIIRPSKVKSGATKFGKNLPLAKHQTNIIDMLPDEPNHILVALDGDFNNRYEVRKIDIRNGRFKEVHGGRRGVQNWMTDNASELRFAFGYTETEERVAAWKNAAGEWINVADTDWFTKYGIFGFDGTAEHFIVSAPTPHGTKGLFRLHIPTGELVEQIFAHETYDIDWMVFPEKSGSIAGVAYRDDFIRYHFFDKGRASLQRAMQKALKGYAIEIVDYDADAGRYLILASNDTEPGLYFQFDRKRKKLVQISPMRPEIYPELMAGTTKKMVPVSGGGSIPVYLTMPLGTGPKNMPAVVLVHGGPTARDDAHWDYWAQFLASRGYAVVKPNFRGSSGYGYRFQRAGHRQWGGLMQQDVADATRHLIQEGVIDPERICIAGASYGGYAALMGLIQTPDLFKCGVSVNGALDLVRMMRRDNYYLGADDWLQSVGLNGADIKDVSPYHQAEYISKPVLLMASKDDARLRWNATAAFNSRLQSMGKASRFVLIEDGGHTMDTVASRLTKLKEMEAFLAEHLGKEPKERPGT